MFEGLGVSGAVLVRAGRAWNASGVRLRASWVRLAGVLGPSWGVLGASWRDSGESWGLPERILGVFLKDFLAS